MFIYVVYLLTEACYKICPFIVEHPDTISPTIKLRGGNVHICPEGYWHLRAVFLSRGACLCEATHKQASSWYVLNHPHFHWQACLCFGNSSLKYPLIYSYMCSFYGWKGTHSF